MKTEVPQTMTLPDTPRMREIAKRVVWYMSPSEALRDEVTFLCQAMSFAQLSDIAYLIDTLGLDAFRYGLANAGPGMVDARSWAFWHVKCGQLDVPPAPVRRFPT